MIMLHACLIFQIYPNGKDQDVNVYKLFILSGCSILQERKTPKECLKEKHPDVEHCQSLVYSLYRCKHGTVSMANNYLHLLNIQSCISLMVYSRRLLLPEKNLHFDSF